MATGNGKIDLKNFFSQVSPNLCEEIIEILVQTRFFRLERIVSTGQSTPKGEWYDQETHEWVLDRVIFADFINRMRKKCGKEAWSS